MPTIVIPWRDTSPDRAKAKRYVIRALRDILPGARIILADSGHKPFNRAASRNRGVTQAGPGVVVVCDADTIPEPAPLLEAIQQAGLDGLLHLPYTHYRALTPAGTTAALSGTVLAECASELEADDSRGGILVMDAQAWTDVGGMDERFTGWGFEDTAFYAVVSALHGDAVRHAGVIHHLWHPSEIDVASARYAANEALCRRYEAACDDPTAMRELRLAIGRQ